jgi:hypothetical protein
VTSLPGPSERDKLLLPFFANGTLENEDFARVKAHLERSEPARQDADFHHRLRTAIQEIEPPEGPTALDRERILARIHREGCVPQRGKLAPWALAAALLLSLVDAAVLGRVMRASGDPVLPDPSASREPSYRLAGGRSAAQLAVQFTDAATAEQIRQLLREHGLLMVDGPSALGVYGLALVHPDADAAAIRQALAALHAETIVRYASLL